MHWEILDDKRRDILPALSFLKPLGFYLAGGTALALHLGHRKSIDFDFYNAQAFQEMMLESEVVKRLTNYKVTQRSSGTLIGQLGPVEVAFFQYPYPLLESLEEADHLTLASIADIAAMKSIAISQRGLRRDFIDLYAIASKHGLIKIFEWTEKKYPQSDRHVLLKALTYFEDADRDESGRGMELKDVSWPLIKSYFEREAQGLAKKWL